MSISNAAYFSTMFDVGSVVGAVSAGFAGSDPRRRIIVIFVFAAFAALFVSFYGHISSFGNMTNMVFIFMSGFMIAGPDSLLGGTTCSDLCEIYPGGSNILSSACGLVNGMGSVGAILSGLLPVLIFETFGWNALFVSCGMLCLVGGLAVLPLMIGRRK